MNDLIYFAIAAIGVVIWNVRLEAKVLYLEKDYDLNKEAVWEKLKDLQTSMNLILQSNVRIETKLERLEKENDKRGQA